MALVDAYGAVVNTYDYDVFGAVRLSTGTQANAFTFTGEQTDASTGLEYLRARYYEAGSGRFLSKDLIHGRSAKPESQNRYVYVQNNSVRLIDPSGLMAQEVVAKCPSGVVLEEPMIGINFGREIYCPRNTLFLRTDSTLSRFSLESLEIIAVSHRGKNCLLKDRCVLETYTGPLEAGVYVIKDVYYCLMCADKILIGKDFVFYVDESGRVHLRDVTP